MYTVGSKVVVNDYKISDGARSLLKSLALTGVLGEIVETGKSAQTDRACVHWLVDGTGEPMDQKLWFNNPEELYKP